MTGRLRRRFHALFLPAAAAEYPIAHRVFDSPKVLDLRR